MQGSFKRATRFSQEPGRFRVRGWPEETGRKANDLGCENGRPHFRRVRLDRFERSLDPRCFGCGEVHRHLTNVGRLDLEAERADTRQSAGRFSKAARDRSGDGEIAFDPDVERDQDLACSDANHAPTWIYRTSEVGLQAVLCSGPQALETPSPEVRKVAGLRSVCGLTVEIDRYSGLRRDRLPNRARHGHRLRHGRIAVRYERTYIENANARMHTSLRGQVQRSGSLGQSDHCVAQCDFARRNGEYAAIVNRVRVDVEHYGPSGVDRLDERSCRLLASAGHVWNCDQGQALRTSPDRCFKGGTV